MSKKIIILAGPNGAGKTTFARYKLAVNDWACYDNQASAPKLTDWGENP